MGQFVITTESGKKFRITTESKSEQVSRQQIPVETNRVKSFLSKDDGSANLLGQLVSGSFKAIESPLEKLGTLSSRAEQLLPSTTKNYKEIVERLGGRVSDKNLFQRGAEYLRGVREQDVPEVRGIFPKVVEGLTQAPSEIGQFLTLQKLLGGSGVAAGGTIGGLAAGPEASPLETAASSAVGAGGVMAIRGLSAITPSLANPVLNSISKTARYGGSAALGVGQSAISGAISGQAPSGDELVAQAIQGVVLADHSTRSAVGNMAALKSKQAVKRTLISLNEPEFRLNALVNLKTLSEKQAKYFKSEIDKANDIYESAQSAAPEEQRRLQSQARSKIDSINEELKTFTSGVNAEKSSFIKTLQEGKKRIESQLNEARVKSLIDQKAEEAADQVYFAGELQSFNENLNKSLTRGASFLRENLPRVFRLKNEQYENRQDKVFDQLGPVNKSDVYTIFQDALSEARDAEVGQGRPYSAMVKVANSLTPQVGQQYVGGESTLTPQQFKATIRNIKRVTGGKNYTDNIPYYILNKKFGEFITERTGGVSSDWKPMNDAFSEVVEHIKQAEKSFKVGKQYGSDVARSTLSKFVEGKYKESPDLERLRKFVESGTEEYPGGLGDVFEEYVSLGKKREGLESRKKSSQEEIKQRYEIARNKIDNDILSLSSDVESLRANKESMSSDILKQKQEDVVRAIELVESDLQRSLNLINQRLSEKSVESNKKVREILGKKERTMVGQKINFEQEISHLQRKIKSIGKIKRAAIDLIAAGLLAGSATRIGISRTASAAKDIS